jgi:hypothetical protein
LYLLLPNVNAKERRGHLQSDRHGETKWNRSGVVSAERVVAHRGPPINRIEELLPWNLFANLAEGSRHAA